MATKKTAKKQVAVAPEAKAPEVPVVGFEDFLSRHKYHPGLVASFKYEASKRADNLKDRTDDEWKLALEEQSNRTY